jgi:hypothetical protein
MLSPESAFRSGREASSLNDDFPIHLGNIYLSSNRGVLTFYRTSLSMEFAGKE